MKKLRDEIDSGHPKFLLRVAQVPISIFAYKEGETPFLIMYDAFDTALCTKEQLLDSLDLLDFFGWKAEDLL